MDFISEDLKSLESYHGFRNFYIFVKITLQDRLDYKEFQWKCYVLVFSIYTMCTLIIIWFFLNTHKLSQLSLEEDCFKRMILLIQECLFSSNQISKVLFQEFLSWILPSLYPLKSIAGATELQIYSVPNKLIKIFWKTKIPLSRCLSKQLNL